LTISTKVLPRCSEVIAGHKQFILPLLPMLDRPSLPVPGALHLLPIKTAGRFATLTLTIKPL